MPGSKRRKIKNKKRDSSNGRGISKHRCSDAGDNTRFNFAFVDTGADILAGGTGDDRLYAEAQIDAATAIAQGNSDTATNAQGDWLAGGAGDDVLIGGVDTNSHDSLDLRSPGHYASVALTGTGDVEMGTEPN